MSTGEVEPHLSRVLDVFVQLQKKEETAQDPYSMTEGMPFTDHFCKNSSENKYINAMTND